MSIYWVIKANGERVKYNRNKIINSLIRAGSDTEHARGIVKQIEGELYDGSTTKEILKVALKKLGDRPEIAMRYNLKQAVMTLGPAGFAFEKFFAEVLRNYGYETKINQIMPGKNVNHEVDVAAKEPKTNKRFMIECKYHNQPGIYTDVKATLYTYARFLDLKKFFDGPWLVSNTKFSSDAIAYGEGVGMRITSWNYPLTNSIQSLIEEKKLYPVTILQSARGAIIDKLGNAGLMLAGDLLKLSVEEIVIKTGIDAAKVKRLHYEAGCICHNGNGENKN
ncbi:MAG: ATP cone domain-containing protein [Nanoarchaeota archaeon]